MTREEFTEKTEYTPSWKEFETIYENYLLFYGDIDEFCDAWIKVNESVIVDQKHYKEILKVIIEEKYEVLASRDQALHNKNWTVADEYDNRLRYIIKKEKEIYEILN